MRNNRKYESGYRYITSDLERFNKFIKNDYNLSNVIIQTNNLIRISIMTF